jgi:hypothetical protein
MIAKAYWSQCMPPLFAAYPLILWDIEKSRKSLYKVHVQKLNGQQMWYQCPNLFRFDAICANYDDDVSKGEPIIAYFFFKNDHLVVYLIIRYWFYHSANFMSSYHRLARKEKTATAV